MFPEMKLRGSLRLEGKQNSQTGKKTLFLLDARLHTNLPRFQGTRPDHVTIESLNCCFPRALVGFVRPRKLVSFNP